MSEVQHLAVDDAVYEKLRAHTCTADGLLAVGFDSDCLTLAAAY